MTLPVPVHLSPSRVDSFTKCAQAFRFKAIDRLPEPETEATLVGNIVHYTLQEWFYSGRHKSGVIHPVYPAYWTDGMTDAERHTLLAERVCPLLANIFVAERPEDVNFAGVELRLECELADHKHVGIIDRLDVEDDGLVVVDYKTGKVPKKAQERDKLMGVMTYALMVEEILGVRPVRVKLIYLQKPLVLTAEPTDQIMRGLRARLSALWERIDIACEREDFRPKVGPLCSWCTYQALCPAWETP